MQNVEEAVIQVLVEKTGGTSISMYSRLADLEMDSLTFVEVVFELEERLDISIAFDFADLREEGPDATVGDLSRRLAEAVKRGPSSR